MRKIVQISIIAMILLSSIHIAIAGTHPQQTVEESNIEFIVKEVNNYENDLFDKLKIVPGEILIQLKPDLNLNLEVGTTGFVSTGIQSIDEINSQYNVIEYEEFTECQDIDELSNIVLLKFDGDFDIFEIIEEYMNDPNVVIVEPNYVYELLDTPNDPYFNMQWSLHNTGQNGGTIDADIDAPDAWDITKGDEDVVICILDTGVNKSHEDLKGKVLPSAWNDDIIGHGTLCAGIAAAVSNNGIGISGVASDCKIMPRLAFSPLILGTTFVVLRGLINATREGADVISMSFGGYFSEIFKMGIDYAHRRGVILIAGAGNSDTDMKFYPAAYENVIAVSATDNNDTRAFFSQYGGWIDVAAPGVDIVSTWKDDNGYMIASGTSFSCPHVAGIAALLISENPYLTKKEIATILRSGVDEVNSDYFIGTGRINARTVLEKAAHVVAEIDSSIKGEIVEDTIKIEGISKGLSYKGYKLEYAKGVYPEDNDWILIKQSSNRVYGGELGQLDTTSLDDDIYNIRLTVENGDYEYIDMTTILVDNTEETIIVDNSDGLKFKVNNQKQFETINEAIYLCGNKDTVFVKSGEYEEVVMIGNNRNVRLIGENKYDTIINSSKIQENTIGVSYSTFQLSGFTIITNESNQFTGFIGVSIKDSEISDNIFENKGMSINSFKKASNNIISNNLIKAGGIDIVGFIRNSIIADNVFNYISLNFFSNNNEICNNEITGGGGFGGIELVYVLSNNIHDNIIKNCDSGIYIAGGFYVIPTSLNTIAYNTIKDNNIGIRFDSGKCKYNLIYGNEILNNAEYGIYIPDFDLNGYETKNNEIYLNNFINNGFDNNDIQARDGSQNIWYKPLMLRGNYWDDYLERYPGAQPRFLIPEVWNTPYDIIDGNNQDIYPLVGEVDENTVVELVQSYEQTSSQSSPSIQPISSPGSKPSSV